MEAAGGALVVLGVAAIIALIVMFIGYAVRRERERQARLQQWAASRGWTVTKRPPPPEWVSLLPGRNRRGVSLLLAGTLDGRPLSVAEYSYTTTSGTSTGTGTTQTTTTHHFTVTVVRLDTPHPPVAVRPRGALSRLGRTVFGDDPAATGNGEFDEQFRVQTKHPDHSRTLVGPALITEHLAERVPAWSLSGQDLVTWTSGRIRDPSEIDALVPPLVRVAALLGR